MSIEERDRAIDEYVEKCRIKREEEESKLPTKDWKVRENEREELQKRQELIKEKGLRVGQDVMITSINMKGVITEIDKWPSRTPITIKREDGETFGYNPYEVDRISKK